MLVMESFVKHPYIYIYSSIYSSNTVLYNIVPLNLGAEYPTQPLQQFYYKFP